jgi:membrane associated rhomboid family serine protease
MGLEDRQYLRSEYDEPRGGFGGVGGQSMVNILIIINVAVFLIDMFSPETNSATHQHAFSDMLSLSADAWRQPWKLYGLLTYGFAHASLQSQTGIWHILMNMFVLWMFGREIERRVGKFEFLRFYLIAIFVSGLVWLVYVNVVYEGVGGLVGASGAVMAVFALFVFYDPKRTLLIWGIFPAPAWLLCGLYVLYDIVGMRGGSHVAHEAHLAGVAFAAVYHYGGWNFGRWLPGSFRWKMPKLGGPKLKVHRPDKSNKVDKVESSYRKLEEEGDRILQKMHTQGEDSLTPAERKTLERYSRRMRQKHQ